MARRFIVSAFISAFLLLFASDTLHAQEKTVGLGIIIGEPTGLSFKGWLDSEVAIDAAAAWSFGHDNSFHLHIDYLVHKFELFLVKAGKMPVYYGIGGRIRFDDPDTRVGARIPFGLSYLLAKDPIEGFFELAPLLDIAPDTDVSINVGIGVRLYL